MIEFRNFENIYVGIVLLGIYLTLYIYFLYKRKRVINRLDPHRNIFSDRNHWVYVLSLIFTILAIILLTTALMRPQTKSALKRVKVKALNVIFCLDVSKSMYARDIPPDRLTNAKNFVRRIVSQFKTENVALMVFSGEALIQCPFTNDYNTFISLLQFAEARNIGRPGTNIAKAIEQAIEYKKKKFLKDIVMVLISDGEAFEGDIDEAIKLAKDEGVIIYTVGVGTPNGEPIPVYNDRGQIVDYKKDKYGNIVVSKLNSVELKRIAEETGGKYLEVKSGSMDEIKFINELTRLKKTQQSELKRYEYNEQYHIFVFLAFLFMILELLLPLFFRLRIRILHILFICFVLFGFSENSLIREGNEAYKKGDYYRAINNYLKVVQSDTQNIVALYNLGNALYKAGLYDTAVMSYSSIKTSTKGQAQIYYNLGNAFFKTGKYREALQSYIKALMLDPSDTDAKYNLEVTLRKMKAGKSAQQRRQQKTEKEKKREEQKKQAIKKLLDNYDKKQKLQKMKQRARARVDYDW